MAGCARPVLPVLYVHGATFPSGLSIEPVGDTAQRANLSRYTMGSSEVAKSPLSMEDWDELKKSALFSEEDVFYLRLSLDALEDQIDDLIKTWRGIIFDQPHLRAYDEDPNTGKVDTEYSKAVGKRFGQWVIDTAKAQYDQVWLDYRYEIGLRHHRSKKNKTDAGHTLGHIRARDLIAFSAAIVVPMKPFLARKGTPGNRQPHVRCLVEVNGPAGGPVVPTLYLGGRRLAGLPTMVAVAWPFCRSSNASNLRDVADGASGELPIAAAKSCH
jgi:hypothetical protein